MLELRSVSKKIQGRQVLRDVQLCLGRGEILCLAGPSGVGKTTLMEIAAGLQKPDKGEVRRKSARIGCALQDAPLLPWQSAVDNMDFFLSTWLESGDRLKMIPHWLERLGLKEAAGKKPSELSGGMKRRLSIACALALDPEILLLDEPLAFLDQHWQDRLMEEIATIHARRTTAILLISHQLEPIRSLGARIVEIHEAPVRLNLS
ncbi:ABC transporter ATP-binding protein [Desulfonatronum sp. SC1]|uniref:ABC transporter ATP-binding protein n=1 Tax=Desulfonatronum sp. SC1 TaxID=2109626 RepID=UPI000D30C77F|nr:ABC transporter ATP-binding protein [Desulfonatronum sp. SC1]PTN38770.1 hypothetical protein C6366_02225 [Desulfonatronum sp. SC1]